MKRCHSVTDSVVTFANQFSSFSSQCVIYPDCPIAFLNDRRVKLNCTPRRLNLKKGTRRFGFFAYSDTKTSLVY